MKKCPKCAEQIQGKAKVCRYCGYEFGLSKDSKGCLTTAAILIALVIMASRCVPARSPDSGANDRALEARMRIENAVKARLRDPESAHFKHFGGGCGYVNSRNGFGGMSGDTPFMVTKSGAMFQDDAPAKFAIRWNKECAK